MRLLLDTHGLIWWWENDPRLSGPVREALRLPETEVFVSVVSAWEIAIKTACGKLRVDADVEAEVERDGFSKLGVEFRHAAEAATLPLHHRDPFDRMLIAQARVEGLTLVTADARFKPYAVPIFWA